MGVNRFLSRFGPLGLIMAVQLILVIVAPSTARISANQNIYSGGTANGSAGGSGSSAPGGSSALGGAGNGTVGGGSSTGGGGVSGGSLGTSGGGGAGSGTGARGTSGGGGTRGNTGVGTDTTHCVAGRQFSPAIDFYAPPCVPGTVGAADPYNGGSTWQGVTGTRIEIVNYVADYGAEVDAILKAQGLYYNAPEATAWNAAYQNFLNAHYQFYGRKVHIDTYQGTCTTVPPDYPCLIGEMDKIVATYHPYAVFWSTTVCSACYAELSRLHVVNLGGFGFSDAFHNANAPYSYDAMESSSRVELQFAKWWCAQMTSQGGSGRTAIFAGTENPAQNFTHDPRVLGVISTNDPDNESTVKNVLYPALKQGCGETVTHQYFYAQNINTATQQSQAGTAAMDTTNNPATSVLCLCDPVAPQFAYNASASDNYWPESLIASDQTMDWDSSAQTYEDSGGNPSLACPNPAQGCSFDNAIGIGSDYIETAPEQMSGMHVWTIATGKATAPVSAAVLQLFWDNYNMLGSLIENTGPDLTPALMQADAPGLGARGGGTTGYPLRQFLPGDWCWTQDAEVAYWDKHRTSPYNGQPGSWVQAEGTRFNMNFPTMSEPAAPLAGQRR
ncbi:MAG: hypothetical protein ACYDAQ_19240 [Mycobacteriales bacterium]